MKTNPLYPIVFLFSMSLHAQQNCSNPVVVNICPTTCLTNQTNAGMGDDAPLACNITGEDVVYKVLVAGGAARLFVTITNASAPLHLIVEHDACSNSGCTSANVSAGNSNSTFTMTATSYYNVWVDAATTVTYGICFGADTDSANVNIPNTQGYWRPDSSICAAPPFSPSKPFCQVTYNNVFQTNPMTLPLNTPGVLCIKTYFKNTTGNEGAKRFVFTFNSSGFSAITASSTSFSGFYNAGTWSTTSSGYIWTFNFADAAGLGRGDFSPPPDSCLGYTFCFNLTPLSNLISLTNINVSIFSDGWGAGFSGWLHYGCCPSQFSNCINSQSSISSASAHSFSFGVNDPGSALPVELTSFDLKAQPQKNNVLVKWTTASEVNNNYFSVERSSNSYDWNEIGKVPGAGNSTNEHNYEYTDGSPYEGTSYYRLKQTDYDGRFIYFPIKEVEMKTAVNISIFPNPAKTELVINTADYKIERISLSNLMGEIFKPLSATSTGEILVDVSALPRGFYMLQVETDGMILKREKIILQN